MEDAHDGCVSGVHGVLGDDCEGFPKEKQRDIWHDAKVLISVDQGQTHEEFRIKLQTQ